MTGLDSLFTPSSLALVGASDRSGWSRTVFEQWTAHSAELPLYCVNPARRTVHGRRSYASLAEIDEPVDLVYVMTAADRVAATLTEAAQCGIHNAVVLTGGFAEAAAEGADRQRALVAAAREHAINLLGPNCNGFINVSDRRVVYGGPLLPPLQGGGMAIVSQSGAIATRLVSMAQVRALGLSKVVTVGNEATLAATSVIRYLIRDVHTRAIALFAESVADTDEFVVAMHEAALAGKPIIILKVGRSVASQHAALDHTGAITGDDDVTSAAFAQWGAIRVRSMEDLIVTAGYLAGPRRHHPRKISIVAASGGAGEIIADRAMDEALQLSALSAHSTDALIALLPDEATIGNPLDVTGRVVGDPALLTNAVEVVRTDPDTELLVVYTTMPRHPNAGKPVDTDFFDTVARINNTPGPGLCVIAQGAADLSEVDVIDPRAALPVFDSIEHCLTALGHAAWWTERATRIGAAGAAALSARAADETAAPSAWGEWRAREFLRASGVPFPQAVLATDLAEAQAAALALGWPVVLKVVSDDILHKTEVGAVALGVATPAQLESAYAHVLASVRAARPDVTPDGVLVTTMRSGGLELLVAVTSDPQWGQVLTVGLGGIWVEILHDVSRRVLPVAIDDIVDMLAELRGQVLLHGARGRAGVDVSALAAVIARVVDVAREHQCDLETIEINPLWADGTDIEALDALVRWRQRA